LPHRASPLSVRQASCTRRPGAQQTVARWLGRTLPVWRPAPSSSRSPTTTLSSIHAAAPGSLLYP